MFKPSVAEPGPGFLVPGEFVRRQQFDLINAVYRALGLWVEGSQGVDFVIEQVYPVGQVRAHGVDVQDCTANGVLTVFVNVLGVMITGGLQLQAPAFDVECLTGFQQQGVALQVAGWRQSVHQGASRDDQDAVTR